MATAGRLAGTERCGCGKGRPGDGRTRSIHRPRPSDHADGRPVADPTTAQDPHAIRRPTRTGRSWRWKGKLQLVEVRYSSSASRHTCMCIGEVVIFIW